MYPFLRISDSVGERAGQHGEERNKTVNRKYRDDHVKDRFEQLIR